LSEYLEGKSEGGTKMDVMTPLVKICGVAIGAKVGEEICGRLGYPSISPFINLVGWFLSGYIALQFVMNQIHSIRGMF
jgi:hypothetical protein